MTIRRGEAWGEPAPSPSGLFVVHDDRDAHHWVVAQRATGRPVESIGLGGGDLARTLGGGSPGRFPGVVMTAPVDAVRVTDGERTTWAVAHVVARRSWWRGEVVLAMNAQYLTVKGRSYDVAPRGHPNDGKIDLLRVDPAMTVRSRLAARRRARQGSHLPHPQLEMSRVADTVVRFRRPLVVYVDGIRWATTDAITLTCEPDALTVFA